MAFLIRKALITDAAEIAQVHIRSWEAAYTTIIPAEAIAEKNAARHALWQKLLTEPDDKRKFVICDDERIAGLMIIEPPRDLDVGEDTLEVGCLYISPDYFGRGYGRSALEYAAECAKGNRYKNIILWVLEENLGARRFYEKCGYTYDGTKMELTIGKPLIGLRYSKEL